MSCECEDAKKWNKIGPKLVVEAMLLGRTLT